MQARPPLPLHHSKQVSGIQNNAGSLKKETIFGAAQTNFRPSYFDRTLGFKLEKKQLRFRNLKEKLEKIWNFFLNIYFYFSIFFRFLLTDSGQSHPRTVKRL